MTETPPPATERALLQYLMSDIIAFDARSCPIPSVSKNTAESCCSFGQCRPYFNPIYPMSIYLDDTTKRARFSPSPRFALFVISILTRGLPLLAESNPLQPGSQLTLCECMAASGGPNGLSCDKDGWFIIGFQHQGTWGGDSGGLLPLSRAICCRPCVPSSIDIPHTGANHQTNDRYHRRLLELGQAIATTRIGKRSPLPPPSPSPSSPSDDEAKNRSKAVAIVSIACHPSSGRGPSQLSCEGKGSSFISGFTQSQRVASYYYDVYYPSGAVECCTPVVLLTTGELWEVTRCNCGR